MQGHMPPQPDQMGGVPGQGYPEQDVGGARQAGGAIDPTRLASASVEEQKTILGEQLYPLIVRREPDVSS